MADFNGACRQVIEAEILGISRRDKLYGEAMRAYAGEHPDVPQDRVCAYTYSELNRRLFREYGRERGMSEGQCKVAKSWFWEVGDRLGYTGMGHAPGSASGTDPTSFIPDDGARPEPTPPPLEGSVPAINAIQELRGALGEMVEYCRHHDVRKALGPSAHEEWVSEISATARLVLDLTSQGRRVPEALQPVFIAAWHAAAAIDGVMRRVYAVVGSAELDRAERLTSKGASNILKCKVKGVPMSSEPRSLWAAILRGFHGAKCKRCGSRRSRPDTDSRSAATLHCLACADGRSFAAPEWVPCRSCHRPLEDPKAIDCPACGAPTGLPPNAGELLAP